MNKFNTSIPGYNKDEVNKFVTEVTNEYENLLNKLKESDAKVASLSAELEHYKQMENTLNRAILLAEESTQNIKKASYDESKVIIEDAKKNASSIVNNALIRSERIETEAEDLRRKVISFKKRFRNLVEENLDEIDKFDDTL
jgi:cell division initiation protein